MDLSHLLWSVFLVFISTLCVFVHATSCTAMCDIYSHVGSIFGLRRLSDAIHLKISSRLYYYTAL